jgi:hypothetical protein
MAEPASTPAKPGTACIGCRRRKLKCSREQEGCSNCLKADLPCVYPTPETGVKRKRGPYKKDKPARERHLEDLVKYLEPKTNGDADVAPADDRGVNALPDLSKETPGLRSSVGFGPAAGNSEDLVKDALVALTKSHATEVERNQDNAFGSLPSRPAQDLSGTAGAHPPIHRIFEYWQLFVERVDPVLKLIHCLSFAKSLVSVIDHPQAAGPMIEPLLFSIYHISVASCSAREARKRFGEDRTALMQQYGRMIEATLADNYAMPTLESLQALILYIVSLSNFPRLCMD